MWSKKLYCARSVHRRLTPVILSNDSGEVLVIKVGSILLRWKFIKIEAVSVTEGCENLVLGEC